MRLLFALSLILAVSLAGLLLLRSGEPPARVIPQNAEVTLESFSVPKAVPVRAQPVAAPHPEAPEAVPSGLRPAAPPVFEEPRSEAIPLEEAGCLLFGPVGERRLTKLRGRLERTGMLGRMLIERACDIARENGYTAINVISAIGTRGYYRKQGFTDNGLYQQRSL